MRVIISTLLLINLLSGNLFGQDRPKLMVAIVVDQMRPEYLTRFYPQFGTHGFKRILHNGFVCNNAHLNYTPSTTGPGHASIFSGTVPQHHGIVGNTWYNRQLKKTIYCAEDSTAFTVGNPTSSKGSHSARNMVVSNLADELKITTVGKGKVVSMSLKDRGAALPAGHMADLALWMDLQTGNFISSSYYVQQLPKWTETFNQQRNAFNYLEKVWEPLMPMEDYKWCLPDDMHFEEKLIGKEKATFPYDLKTLAPLNSPYFEPLNRSPFGNSLLTDLAIEAIDAEHLGSDGYTDFLTISFSSTDAVGHTYGPSSVEVNDTYLRLDRDLARLLSHLDKTVGKNNYTLLITSDHGVGEPPQYLLDNNVPGGFFDDKTMRADALSYLNAKFGQGNWIEDVRNHQFYLNRQLMAQKSIDSTIVQDALASYLLGYKGIAETYAANWLLKTQFSNEMAERAQKSYSPKRCGDVLYMPQSGLAGFMKNAATHGSTYTYDTHIVLLWYGKNVNKGSLYQRVNITDIAPTAAMLMQVTLPSAAIGEPIQQVIGR